MGSIKEINIKEQTYYFYNDIIDLKTFDSKNLKLNKKNVKRSWYLQYWIRYNQKICDCYDVNSVNP